MNDYEDVTWFDANGRKLAGNWNTSALVRPRSTGSSSRPTLKTRRRTRRPTVTPPPFYKADRIAEYRQAHAAFTERMKGGGVMRPTLAAEELKRNLTQYLTTTFALADRPARESLERFLNDPANGMFRGPYLRIRTAVRARDGRTRGGRSSSGRRTSLPRTCTRSRRGSG